MTAVIFEDYVHLMDTWFDTKNRQGRLRASPQNVRYNIDLLGAIHLLNISWKELVPSKVINCFEHAGFSRRTIVSDPDDDRTCSDLYEAVDKIARQDVEGDFKTFALADAAAPVVAPATDAEIIDTVGGPDKDEEPREVPTMVQTREPLRLLQNKVNAWVATTVSCHAWSNWSRSCSHPART
ncbi:hypothetical protein HPB52_025292 [Rhipicephalus sanguineus]|uniref:DDE-1 domain-containing protein n=1 Tax=Rhipicephalus sanguineus TaxID=34632 RepID=A0A9D4YRT4_RHISA|nr:hypothetical protein HPB52_025292 [Rhipicephalus sanguineus]